MLTLSRLPETKLFKSDDGFVGRFQAMGSPCEIHFDTDENVVAAELFEVAVNEARRVECKWSRYVEGNIIHRVNTSNGQTVQVDEETARLLDFAETCYQLSDGLFDITYSKKEAALVGWDKAVWRNPLLQLRPGMQIDLGGIGKEYAVDRALQLMREKSSMALLVNFGGDIAAAGRRRNGRPWLIGIEDPNRPNTATKLIELDQGAVATSGNGKRQGHIYNPRTGKPAEMSRRTVTVQAATCTQAGYLSTLGILQGVQL